MTLMRSLKRNIFSGVACLGLIAGCAAAPDSRTGSAASAAKDEINPAPPVIPDAKFNLADYGAVGDGKTLNTEAFKSAVMAIAKAGGGHLIIPAGIYKTLSFTLTSHMDLHLNAGAMIKAPDTLAEYGIPDPNQSHSPGTTEPTAPNRPPRARVMPLISCPAGTTDLAITGTGTIDGSGAIFWIWSDKAARQYPKGRTILARPFLVALNGVQRLHVDGITLSNSPMFHLVPRGVQDALIENIRIFSPSDAPNTDAINIGGNRVVIRHCEIDNGDDNVAVQSGSHNVLIEDLTCLHGHGISIGSSTKNGLSHMIVRRCTFDGTDNGLRIKSYRGSGGDVHDIQYSDITMRNVKRPFDINMRYDGNADKPNDVGPREPGPKQTVAIPDFHDIHVTNLTVTRSPIAGRIIGLPEKMPHSITFTNVNIQSDRGFLVLDAKDITFENSTINAAVGDPFVLQNATIKSNGTTITGPVGGPPDPFY